MTGRLSATIERVRRFLQEDLWQDPGDARTPGAIGLRVLQLVAMVGQGFLRDRLLLRASALTYIAALTLIPLLVLVLSIFKGIGLGDEVVLWVVDQLTAVSPDAAASILSTVQDADLGALGSVGAVLTFITTVLALRHAEFTLNEIWGVRRNRPWLRRLADYLLVIVVVPLVTSVAFSLETTLQSEPLVRSLLDVPIFELLYHTGLRQVPWVLLILGFTFIYWFLPNTDVRPLSALLGGTVAGVLFVLAQRYFLGMLAGAAKYNVLFGSFAAIPLILFWMYLAFAIVLLGAEISYAHQHLARYRREVRGSPPGAAEREALGLQIAAEIARRFRDREPPPTPEELCDALDVSVRTVRALLDELEAGGVVAQRIAEEREGGYQPGRPAETVTIGDVLRALRGDRQPRTGATPSGRAVDGLLREIDENAARLEEQRTLADVIGPVPGAA